jgi:hypothetical protein
MTTYRGVFDLGSGCFAFASGDAGGLWTSPFLSIFTSSTAVCLTGLGFGLVAMDFSSETAFFFSLD